MLEEAQLPARSQHAPSLGERGVLVDGAQHQREHHRVRLAVGQRQRVRGVGTQLDPLVRTRRGVLAQVGLRLDGDDPLDVAGVEGEAGPVARPDLHDGALQPLEQRGALLVESSSARPRQHDSGVEAGEQRVLHRRGHAGHHVTTFA